MSISRLTCDLDGNCREEDLDPPRFCAWATIALPNGMMACVVNDGYSESESVRVAMVDVDGNVVWQQSSRVGVHGPYASLMYHERFNELVVYGSEKLRDEDEPDNLFVIALDMFGEVRWQLRRQSPLADLTGSALPLRRSPRPLTVIGQMLQARGGRLIGLLQPVRERAYWDAEVPVRPLEGWNELVPRFI